MSAEDTAPVLTAEQQRQQERKLAEHLRGVLRFTVNKVGEFTGRRLNASEHLDALLVQAAILEERLQAVRKKHPEMAYMTADALPMPTQNHAYYMAMLEAADVTPMNEGECPAWNGTRETDADVLSMVYFAWLDAKNAAFREDGQAVADLKNSSGGQGD